MGWIRLTPGCQHLYRNMLHMFITSTRNQIDQQINSLLMEAACWWRQPADGGSSVMEAACWWRQLGLDNMSCISFTATADWWWRTTSNWTTGSHQNTTNTTLNTSRWTVRRSTGDHSRSAAAENGRRVGVGVGVGEPRAGSVGNVSVIRSGLTGEEPGRKNRFMVG